MPVSVFEPRTLLGVWEQTKRAQRFLQTFVFGRIFQSMTEHIDMDEVTSDRPMAPFVSLTGAGKVVGRGGHKRNQYIPPKLAPKIPTTDIDLQSVLPGEPIYGGMSPEERHVALVQRDLMMLDDMNVRRIEWMCAQILFTGKVTMVGDDFSDELDFGFTNTETLGNDVQWNDAAGDPLGDLGRWGLDVAEDTGVVPNTCIMALDVAKAFRTHSKVVDALDTTKQALLAVQPRTVPGNGRYIGTYTVPELGPIDMYTYPEWYKADGTGTSTPIVPSNKLALFNNEDSFLTAYGAYIDLATAPATVNPVPMYPRSWYEAGPNQRFLELISRPLPAPTRTNAWFVADVL